MNEGMDELMDGCLFGWMNEWVHRNVEKPKAACVGLDAIFINNDIFNTLQTETPVEVPRKHIALNQ